MEDLRLLLSSAFARRWLHVIVLAACFVGILLSAIIASRYAGSPTVESLPDGVAIAAPRLAGERSIAAAVWGLAGLVVVGLVIGGVALRFLWTLIGDFRRSADAALQTAAVATAQTDELRRQFAATHRPRLEFRLALTDPPPKRGDNYKTLCVIRNSGETTAHINWIGSVVFCDSAIPAMLPPLIASGDRVDLAGGQAHRWNGQAGEPISDWELLEINAGRRAIYCAGVVRYADGAGVAREDGFCRRYDPASGRFVATGDPDHEYGG